MNIKDLNEKLNGILIDLTENIQDLYEMSIDRQGMKRKIVNLAEKYNHHLGKILYLGNKMPENIVHWCSEIKSILQWIVDRNMNDCKVNTKLINEWLNDSIVAQNQMIMFRDEIAYVEKLPEEELKPVKDNDFEVFDNWRKELAKLTMDKIKNKETLNKQDILKGIKGEK